MGLRRAKALAESIQDPLDRDVALANCEHGVGGQSRALELVAGVLRKRPDHEEARAFVIRVYRQNIAAGGELPVFLREGNLTSVELAIISGARLEQSGQWDKLRELETVLATVAPQDPLYPEATRLRVVWRAESGDPKLARESLALMEPLQSSTMFTMDYFLRARVAIAAQMNKSGLGILAELAGLLPPNQRQFASEALAILDTIPAEPDLETVRSRVKARLDWIAYARP